MQRRPIPIDLLGLTFLILSIFYPWPSGLHDFSGWAIRLTFAMLSTLTMVAHLVLNVRLFKTVAQYVWLAADALVLMIALLWALNLLIGLQGMS